MLSLGLVVTCEHGGNHVPDPYAGLFRGHDRLLETHRGYDRGALTLATRLACTMKAPLVASTVTRLLIDLNRSPGHPAQFSRFTKELDQAARQTIQARFYEPYRARVATLVQQAIVRRGRVVHLSIHSFTPVRAGVVRRADVGLLYDPSRQRERAFCNEVASLLRSRRPDLVLRRNYPYRGTADGLVTSLRKQFPPASYAGIEVEVNQRWTRKSLPSWEQLQKDVIEVVKMVLRK